MVEPSEHSKRFFVADLKPQDVVRSTFLVRSKGVMQAKNGRPYLALTLSDRTGIVDTRVWSDDAVELADRLMKAILWPLRVEPTGFKTDSSSL